MSAPRIPGLTYIQHIGQGGFADVFLYEQEWPRQRVAVKVVRPDVPLTEREKAMFTTEANAMARLSDHPYIVSVLTAGVTSTVVRRGQTAAEEDERQREERDIQTLADALAQISQAMTDLNKRLDKMEASGR